MSKTSIYLLAVALFLGTGSTLAQTSTQQEKDFLSRIFKNDPAYLFCYSTPGGRVSTTGNDSESQLPGLRFLYSYDGLLWKKAGGGATYFTPGKSGGQSLIDPSIAQGSDGKFHLVWATDSTKGSIGYACSSDLIHWSEEKILPVGAGAAQAPELFYHKASKTFYLMWASASNTLYFATTKNFSSFKPVNSFYQATHEVNDPFVLKKSGSYHLFFKNDNNQPLEKNLHMTSSLSLKKFPATTTEPLTGTEPSKGPCAIQIGKYIYLYYNNYNTNTYRAMRCKYLKDNDWEDVTSYLVFPSGNAQGTVFKVDDAVLHDVQSFPNDR